MKLLQNTLLALGFAMAVSRLVGQPTAYDPFPLLDLDRPGLERVRAAYDRGDRDGASVELLAYYRNRTPIVLPGLDPDKVRNNANEQRWADESLGHKFYAQRGYESFFYGDDIDWTYWPVQDNELRWQLHRHYWFIPLAVAYRTTGDEKYIRAWIEHYTDWVKKNPIVEADRPSDDPPTVSSGEIDRSATASGRAAMIENTRFAWRPLEVSRRVQDQVTMFALTVDSPSFTPQFLDMFLAMYHLHADRVLNNYSKQGNHLLFEAQRMVYAGIYFPEFRDAARWRESGIEILNREIGVQVYPDGMQFELDPGYHAAAIDIFLKALDMAKANGMDGEFPASYTETVERMIEATWNLMFPDYTDPIFSDHKLESKSTAVRRFRTWERTFPDNAQIAWFASEGRRGSPPPYLSKALTESGFFVFRNGWESDATVMILKAGPPAFWHNQPDNGTFELWRRGRNFFMDSGSYVYSGSAEVQQERDWFRQTRVHNTLTLDNRTIEKTDSKTLAWKTGGEYDLLVTENESYPGLSHRRSVFFFPDGVFVIADQAVGSATGDVAVHFNLTENALSFDRLKQTVRTTFEDGNNIVIKTFSNHPTTRTEEEGWVSRAYRVKDPRPAYAVRVRKENSDPVMFVTVIAPTEIKGDISTEYRVVPDGMTIEARIGDKQYKMNYQL